MKILYFSAKKDPNTFIFYLSALTSKSKIPKHISSLSSDALPVNCVNELPPEHPCERPKEAVLINHRFLEQHLVPSDVL